MNVSSNQLYQNHQYLQCNYHKYLLFYLLKINLSKSSNSLSSLKNINQYLKSNLCKSYSKLTSLFSFSI